MFLVRIALDEAKFEESKHPRDDDGKFTAGGGGGGASSAPKKTKPSGSWEPTKHVTGVLKAKGFAKVKNASSDLPTYVHPSGIKVIFHEPEGDAKFSSKWSLEEHQGSGKAVGDLIDKVLAKNNETETKAKSIDFGASSPSGAAEKWVDGLGIKGLAAKEVNTAAKKAFEAHPKDAGDFADAFAGNLGALSNKGIINTSQEEEIYNQPWSKLHAQMKGEAPAPAAAPPVAEKKSFTSFNTVKATLEKKGFEWVGMSGPDKVVYKNGDKLVQFETTGKWIAQAPGFPTKTGEGVDNLAKLMNGGTTADNPGAWTVTSEAIKDPTAATKAAQEAKTQETKKKSASEKGESYSKWSTIKTWSPTPSSNEHSAIAYYSSSGYSHLNSELRHQTAGASTMEKVARIDEYLDKTEVKEPITVYRKVSGEYSKILKSISDAGTIFKDRGFASTSINQGVWSGDLQMKINVPKGAKGASIQQFSHHPDEQEFLIPRNSFFKVKHYDHKSGFMEVDLVQDHMK